MTLFIDITTAFQEAGRHAHGTTRVERGLAAALAKRSDVDIAFCRFERGVAAFAPLSREEALAVATAPTRPERRRTAEAAWRKHRLLAPGRRLEALVRETIGKPLRRKGAALARRLAPPKPLIGPGDTLLIPGELQRHDFAQLIGLKRAGVRLAFLFYDVLSFLADDDPRLADQDAWNIPGADFILRHADVALPISRFTEGQVRALAARRGGLMPPLSVIRLGLTPPAASDGSGPIEGLPPGEFVLAVGDVSSRKNQQLLAKVWRQLSAPPRLVLAGRIEAEQADFVRALKSDPVLGERIFVLPNAADETLWRLYRTCRFTVFASLAEGFGLPVAESLSFGKLCVASSAMAIPEASQSLAIHLHPKDESAWRETIQRLIDDPDELARREREIAARFKPWTWDDAADDVLAAICGGSLASS